MNILSWIKGKLKQREMRKLEPDNDFEFEENYYGDSNIIDGFNFIYCNNYTDQLCNSNRIELSFISCVISLPAELKVLNDLVVFMNNVIDSKTIFDYKNIYIKLGTKNVKVFLRGDISFYSSICRNTHNNIFTKYIRNNLFPEEMSIETPNEFLNNIFNSITNPYKDIDILFIEDESICKELSPVIGLSLSKKYEDKVQTSHIVINNRIIIYLQLNQLMDNEISYLIENVKHCDKLMNLFHKHITDNDYLDIDEVIEE